MVERESTLLPIITFDAKTTWDDVLRLAAPHLNESGVNRLMSALGSKVKCVVVDRHYIDKDYRDTFANYHAKKFSTPDSRCVRLHFFDADMNHDSIRDVSKAQSHYLGYSVLRPTRPNCIGRTLLSPRACEIADAHICMCVERVSIQGMDLRIEGFPFISQDADVTVCAQSALWMLVRYFSNRYTYYPETYPFRLTTLTQDYSIGRLMPTSGLRVWQMAEALRRLGFAPLLYDRPQYKDFDHLMYTYVESGIPILAAFRSHVVTLFGHRSDYAAVPTATPSGLAPFVYSSAFNRAFVGNDDNGVPYELLSDSSTVRAMQNKISEVEMFIAPLPERVFLPAESFQAVVEAVLQRTDLGYKTLSQTLSKTSLCLRLFLTSGQSFKKLLDQRGMGHEEVAATYRSLPLPHFIWVCELSTPTLYPKHVLGEVIWDATRNAYEPDGWIALHYPEILVVDVGSALNGPQKLLRFPIPAGKDYPIYENNLITL